jgi:RNA polymerase sigma-70 factor (ECF subfamily)
MENPPEALDVQSTVSLLDMARSGDDKAVELLYRRYLPPLQRWARGRLPSWARDLTETDDLVQDTLLRTLHRLDDFEYLRTGAFLSYLRQGVMNRVRDEIRRVGRRPPGTESASRLHAHDPSPIEELIGKETLERYEGALAELKPADREAAIARIELELDYRQIAQLLGKPSPDAARMAVSRALVRLAKVMKESEGS